MVEVGCLKGPQQWPGGKGKTLIIGGLGLT